MLLHINESFKGMNKPVRGQAPVLRNGGGIPHRFAERVIKKEEKSWVLQAERKGFALAITPMSRAGVGQRGPGLTARVPTRVGTLGAARPWGIYSSSQFPFENKDSNTVFLCRMSSELAKSSTASQRVIAPTPSLPSSR